MLLSTSLTKLRRFLRDPDAEIWSDSDLMVYWNEAQMELAVKTGYIERIEAYFYPPEWNYTYLWEWEIEYTDGDRVQVLTRVQQSDYVCCYPWEPFWDFENQTTPDDGYRITQSWENEYGASAAPVPVPLSSRFHRMILMAWDEQAIYPKTESEIALIDRFYQTTVGEPVYYYQKDDYSNIIYLYPKPSSITWDTTEVSDVVDDVGELLESSYDWLDDEDLGAVTQTINTDGTLFAVFQAIPYDMETTSDTCDSYYPAWMIKYVEYSVLERAFGADTDGYIPSLRDYWKQRKELGIQAIKRFMRMRLADKTYRLGGSYPKPVGSRLRLPAGYPAV